MNPISLMLDLRGWIDTRRSAVATMTQLARLDFVPKTLIDAGANNSQWMRRLAARYPKAKVLSFEPQNNCRPIGIVRGVALSDCEGTSRMHGTGTSAFLDCGIGSPGIFGAAGVTVHKLDRYAGEVNRPALLKVDCEDHTFNALNGGPQVLEKCLVVVVEIWEGLDWPCADRNRHAEIHSLLWMAGFNRAMTVGAMPWRNHVSQTDVLFWKE